MMENHSFENYLGTLGPGGGLSLGEDGTPDAENPDSARLVLAAPPHTWSFGAVAASPVEAFEFDGRAVRACCETDPVLGYGELASQAGSDLPAWL